jgi:lysophospholipase L1-like esterase
MRNLFGAVALVFAVGCSSSTEKMPPPGVGGGGDVDGGGMVGGGGLTSIPATAQIGTYIALGDSISDRGGTGPFFYDLLNKNDDATYSDFAGKDLATKYPGIMYVHGAVAGAVTDAYADLSSAPFLKSQITKLGSSYPGDVLVTITIGGNDLNGHAVDAIGGKDDAVKAEFAAHLADELGELTKPGRLGSGKVYVVISNIYDFTDGQGDFRTVKCGPFVDVMPAKNAAAFTAWNGIMADAAKTANALLYDMHANFNGHGYNTTNPADLWYDRNSCIHPNAKGHDQIRRSIWKLVSGE